MDVPDKSDVADANCIICNGEKLPPPSGLSVRNFLDPAVYRFVNQKRSPSPINELILHETVTRTWQDTVSVLKPQSRDNPNGRGLGVHFIVDPIGLVYQHGDVATDFLWHASQHNPKSVGIECVNPYYPKFMPMNGPWAGYIDAPWADGARYVVPTAAQSEAVFKLFEWLTSDYSGLSIPKTWTGVSGTSLAFGKIATATNPAPGIYAHHYFGHADGCWLVLYCWLRSEAKLTPEQARDEAIKLATDAFQKVDLSAHISGGNLVS